MGRSFPEDERAELFFRGLLQVSEGHFPPFFFWVAVSAFSRESYFAALVLDAILNYGEILS